ncbi:nuclear transport factor 2 family protein [Rhodococcus erythropolis]|uniref:nuclear transport factor 2 family protein n=1 Tax=Rhodococcus erythropolis TaxID=1833 RepID=UPI00366B5096
MTSSSARHEALVDKDALRELISRFGFTVDSGNYTGLYSLLSEEVVMEIDERMVIRGVEKLVRMGDEPVWGATQHLYTDVVPDVTGNRATILANLVAIHVQKGKPSEHYDFGARYKFEAERADDGSWWLSRIVITKLWESGNDQQMFE